MDDVRAVTLGGKARLVAEPPMGRLRRILRIYRELAAASDADRRLKLAEQLLETFFPGQRLGVIGSEEMNVFLNAIPDLCGLERAKPGAIEQTDDQAFGNVYAHLAASFGWDYDIIDQQITMSKLKDMAHYMKRNPPTHQLVAAYLGYDYQSPEDKLRRFFLMATSRA